MKYIVNLIRVLVGALFIFSGSVKAIDPLGTSYKMHDYFSAFSYDFEFLQWFFEFLSHHTVSQAVFMIVFEIALGVALLIGWRPKLTNWLLMGMVGFFTVLTGYTYLTGYTGDGKTAFLLANSFFALIAVPGFLLAWKAHKQKYLLIFAGIAFVGFILLNISAFSLGYGYDFVFEKNDMKVTDCGCFGDFLKLEPKTSFLKDVVLSILILVLLVYSQYIKPIFSERITTSLVGFFTLASLIFCFSGYVWDLPVVDFRPYKIGNHIPTLMEPEKPRISEWEFVYTNNETGEDVKISQSKLKEIDYDKFTFKDRVETVIDPGIEAKILNFDVVNDEGEEMNNELLYNEKYTLMVVSYDLSKTNTDAFVNKINPLAKAAEEAGVALYVMTNSESEDFRHEYQTMYPFYHADGTFLKTIIRSNPGVLLIRNGVVEDKWHHRQLPLFTKMDGDHGISDFMQQQEKAEAEANAAAEKAYNDSIQAFMDSLQIDSFTP